MVQVDLIDGQLDRQIDIYLIVRAHEPLSNKGLTITNVWVTETL